MFGMPDLDFLATCLQQLLPPAITITSKFRELVTGNSYLHKIYRQKMKRARQECCASGYNSKT
jgi:hypothetical protein